MEAAEEEIDVFYPKNDYSVRRNRKMRRDVKQKKNETVRFPVIDTGRCSLCQGCASVLPEVFFLDEQTGRMSVVLSADYPENLVEEAIKNCPKDCISWDRPLGKERDTDFTEEEILGIG